MTIRRYARFALCMTFIFGLEGWNVDDLEAEQLTDQQTKGHGSESRNLALVGVHDLQGRAAYQPIIHRQGKRWIAYVGTHEGAALNPISGLIEGNGTVIVEVTNPRKPVTLFHIPGHRLDPNKRSQAQMVRVCDIEEQTYLLRSSARTRHEIWNVIDPSAPQFVSTVIDGLTDTHKSWWECDTGIAYIVAGDPAWRMRMTKIFNLSKPEEPVLVRDFGLVGQEPGSQVEPVPPVIHGPISRANRVYFAYGTSRNGVLQMVDRDKLLKGKASPTAENLLHPQVGRLDLPPFWGVHTSFPVIDVQISDFGDNLYGRTRDFVILTSESTRDGCQEFRHGVFFVDITDETRPFPVASFQVSESSGDFCQRGGRFGPHATNESFTPIYYRRIVFVSYFNAGVRAVDIRDPFHPREVAFFIPATTEKTEPSCMETENGIRCKAVIQTNNVEVDDRGMIYIVDRANTGMHILELTGAARRIANFP
ncbi:hypothetical protein MYX82_07995 [Acidobacteria bacterium AH-259-D05]|nr:hypothetical protein [Acidobacteria bacterium AH-259-D05]